MTTITSRFTAEELHEKAIEVVAYNNEIHPGDTEKMFTATSTKAFYTEKSKDLFLVDTENGSGKTLVKINKEQLEAMFVLYENIADALKSEKE